MAEQSTNVVTNINAPAARTPVETRRPKKRRWLHVSAFVLLVVMPTVLAAWYLFTRAGDQYHSTAAFSVRSEDFQNPLDALGAFTQIGSSSASDNVILYDYIRSQPLMHKIDETLDLRSMFNKAPQDFVFSLGEDASREDMLDFWNYMVGVAVDTAGGVIDIHVRAFAPEDAQAIAQQILIESSTLINDLSRIAQEDAMRFALEDVADAEARLKRLRQEIRVFRIENQLIDPEASVESQMGVLSELQSQLAAALVAKGTLQEVTAEGDPRFEQVERRIRAIRRQIAEERAAVSNSIEAGESLSDLIGTYEGLLVDREFSEQTYTAALAAADQARAEARRKSRYVAVHIEPTIADDSQFPKRWVLLGLVFFCGFAFWSVVTLIYYNVRDRS